VEIKEKGKEGGSKARKRREGEAVHPQSIFMSISPVCPLSPQFINVGKLARMRIGSRHHVKSMNISTVNSGELVWCEKIKYLGIDLAAARVFKCLYDNAKRTFYRAFNAFCGENWAYCFRGGYNLVTQVQMLASIVLWSRCMPGK